MSGVELIVLFDHFDRFIAGLPSAIGDGNEELAQECSDTSAHNAPVLSGELRDSHHVERHSDTDCDAVADAGHAIYVEMGTRYMPAQPFMTPASQSVSTNAADHFIKRIEALV